MERNSPEVALANNTPSGIKAMQEEILRDIKVLDGVRQSCLSLGFEDDATWCLKKAVWMTKWLIDFGYFKK